MKSSVRHGLIVILALAGAFDLPAKNLSDYQVGDLAEANIVAPAALDVPVTEINPAAAARAPAVFRDFPAYATNALAQDFLKAFAATHEEFLSTLQQKYSRTVLDDKLTATLEFGYLVKNFNLLNRAFPLSSELAMQWAQGRSGSQIQTNLLARLLAMMHRPVCADEFPPGFTVSESFYAVPVAQPQQIPALNDVELSGHLIKAADLTSVSRLRMLFRHSFPKEEQVFANAYANFLRPVCVPDVELTRQFRAQSAVQIVGTTHYAAGQIIVPRGAAVDAKSLAVMAQIRDLIRLPTETPPLMSPAIVGQSSLPVAAPITVVEAPSPALTAAQFRSYLGWLVAAVVGFVAASVIAILLARRMTYSPVNSALPAVGEPADYAPQISQAVKSALLDELAAIRAELHAAQQTSAPTVFTTGSNGNGAGHTSGETISANGREQCVAGLLAEAETLFAANEYENSLKCFEAVLALQPEHPGTLVKMGNALERLGRTDEAIACFDRAIAADDTMIAAHLQKGGLFNRLARHQEAAKCFEQALLKQRKTNGVSA